MVIDDIALQRESSRKTIRYEAHKFRLKNSKYYNHPLGATVEAQTSATNIAPQNWKPSNEPRHIYVDIDLSNGYSSDENNVEFTSVLYPRQKGTRPKKSAVRFSLEKGVQDGLKSDDLENTKTEKVVCPFSKRKQELNKRKFRSSSAMQYRDKPEVNINGIRRQNSAFPAVRNYRGNSGNVTPVSAMDYYSEYARDSQRHQVIQNVQVIKSESYFDKSKAVYQLRQDLRKRAELRKQGVTTAIFTRQDAINLEKETFIKSNDKIIDYIKRMEDVKKAETILVNRWTAEEVGNQIHI